MKKYCLFIIAGLLISLSACKELYHPEVDQVETMLVVEGLITNEHKHHTIRLTHSVGYNDAMGPVPVQDAEVYVRDDQGNHYPFGEQYWDKGNYSAWYAFAAQPGREYTLTIRTRDGLEIESTPQQALEMTRIDSVGGVFGKLEVVETNDTGGHYVMSLDGLEVFIDITRPSGEAMPLMRYEARILQMYHSSNEWGEVTFFWRTMTDPGPPNVNFQGVNQGQGGLKNHYLTFIPFSSKYYRIPEGLYMNGRYVLIKKFRLNEDSHRFYKEMARQLSSGNQLFDPIAAQIAGNLTCTSHPEKKVLGLFEVSSFEGETYSVRTIAETGLIDIQPYEDLNHIAPAGSIFMDQPSFWRWN